MSIEKYPPNVDVNVGYPKYTLNQENEKTREF